MNELVILLLTLFFVNLMYIAVKAFQQLNVVHKVWAAVLPCSFIMAYIETFIVHQIAVQGFSHTIALAIGLGGGIGCLMSMWLHPKIDNFWIWVKGKWYFRVQPILQKKVF